MYYSKQIIFTIFSASFLVFLKYGDNLCTASSNNQVAYC